MKNSCQIKCYNLFLESYFWGVVNCKEIIKQLNLLLKIGIITKNINRNITWNWLYIYKKTYFFMNIFEMTFYFFAQSIYFCFISSEFMSNCNGLFTYKCFLCTELLLYFYLNGRFDQPTHGFNPNNLHTDFNT